jgi:hypothetical protein
MAVAKKKPAKKTTVVYSWGHIIFGVILLFALGVGLITAYRAGATRQMNETPVVASGTAIEKSRDQITKEYLEVSTTDCKNDDLTQVGRVAVFYKYLRVNLHNNRAVIRGCNNSDTLLAHIDGKWQATSVNMNLDASANFNWQRACDIVDITRTDKVARLENVSIDANNLKMCNALKNDKILTLQDI